MPFDLQPEMNEVCRRWNMLVPLLPTPENALADVAQDPLCVFIQPIPGVWPNSNTLHMHQIADLRIGLLGIVCRLNPR